VLPAPFARFRLLAGVAALTTAGMLGLGACGTVPAPSGYVTAMPSARGGVTQVPTTPPPMDESRFWSIIEDTGAAGSAYGRAKTLRARLEKLPPPQIAEFDRHMTEAVNAIAQPRHLGAAEVLMGFTSEEAFIAFRAWIVAQGHVVHARFEQDPDALVDLAPDREGEMVASQMILFTPDEAYEDVTGKRLVDDFPDLPLPERLASSPDGPSYAQLAKDLPRLAGAYLPVPTPARNAFADGPRGIRRHG
jgi:hypothetical protein